MTIDTFEALSAFTAENTGEDGAFNTEGQEEKKPFIVDTAEKANWCLQLLTELAEQDAQEQRVANEQIARAELWLSRQRQKRSGQIEWLKNCITFFAREQNAADPKKKTFSLPFGKLSLRVPGWKLSATDEEAALAWLEDNGHKDLIRTKKEPNIAELKKLVAKPEIGDGKKAAVLVETGEVLPGLEVETGDCLVFSYELTEGGLK